MANKVHDPGDARPFGINDVNNRLIVTKEKDAFVGKIFTPQVIGNNERK